VLKQLYQRPQSITLMLGLTMKGREKRSLYCDSDDIDDDDISNPAGVDVGDGAAYCSQTVDLNLGLAMEPLPSKVVVQIESPNEAVAIILDPLFNAARKAPHPNAIIVKQEVGWFQLREEKCQKKTVEKLALQCEKECLAKDTKDK
jgi:hypothetical protein